MSPQRWSRSELARIVAARHGQVEGHGPGAFIDIRLKVTPELLESLLGGYWTSRAGVRAEFDGIVISDDGYAEPLFHTVPSGSTP